MVRNYIQLALAVILTGTTTGLGAQSWTTIVGQNVAGSKTPLGRILLHAPPTPGPHPAVVLSLGCTERTAHRDAWASSLIDWELRPLWCEPLRRLKAQQDWRAPLMPCKFTASASTS